MRKCVTRGISGSLLTYVDSMVLGPIYTKRQRQRCDDPCNSILIENNRVALEWVYNHFQATPLFSMRTESQT